MTNNNTQLSLYGDTNNDERGKTCTEKKNKHSDYNLYCGGDGKRLRILIEHFMLSTCVILSCCWLFPVSKTTFCLVNVTFTPSSPLSRSYYCSQQLTNEEEDIIFPREILIFVTILSYYGAPLLLLSYCPFYYYWVNIRMGR